jgi:hypothetical protein
VAGIQYMNHNSMSVLIDIIWLLLRIIIASNAFSDTPYCLFSVGIILTEIIHPFFDDKHKFELVHRVANILIEMNKTYNSLLIFSDLRMEFIIRLLSLYDPCDSFNKVCYNGSSFTSIMSTGKLIDS